MVQTGVKELKDIISRVYGLEFQPQASPVWCEPRVRVISAFQPVTVAALLQLSSL